MYLQRSKVDLVATINQHTTSHPGYPPSPAPSYHSIAIRNHPANASIIDPIPATTARSSVHEVLISPYPRLVRLLGPRHTPITVKDWGCLSLPTSIQVNRPFRLDIEETVLTLEHAEDDGVAYILKHHTKAFENRILYYGQEIQFGNYIPSFAYHATKIIRFEGPFSYILLLAFNEEGLPFDITSDSLPPVLLRIPSFNVGSCLKSTYDSSHKTSSSFIISDILKTVYSSFQKTFCIA